MVLHLLAEALRHLLEAERALERSACQVILLLVDRELSFAPPLGRVIFIFLPLFLEKVLVGKGNRHLRLHLHELILHIKDDLLDQLFGIFRFVDQIIQVCPY